MEFLTVREVAAIKGCSDRYVKKLVADGHLEHIETLNSKNRKKYLIPLTALENSLQIKYYKQKCQEVPAELVKAKTEKPRARQKSLDEFTATERAEIEQWIHILTDWASFRGSGQHRNKAEADQAFLVKCRGEYGKELKLSIDILYRKQKAYQNDDLDGLVDKRGTWKKGKSSIPEEIKGLFIWAYLDEHRLSVQKCMEATQIILQEEKPEQLPFIPAYDTFARWARDYPNPVKALLRDGSKAFDDSCGVYINRIYDDMESNDFWIADGHRIDVITRAEDGSEQNRRLTISAIIDAYSGVYTGWTVTDNPSSESTMLALRKAIIANGACKYFYVDNGREYLNADIGGLGHRARKNTTPETLPTPILARLGIKMTNALPRNGRAKIIEREFRNFTFLSQLFETYCGSSVATKPEKLKIKLKEGEIPTDSQLIQAIDDMIAGYFNQQPYNGKVIANRGKTKWQVYKENLKTKRVVAEADLNLLLMRSTRLQTVGRNGVHLIIRGKKIFFFDDNLMLHHNGQKVFVRYDPSDLREVRIYDTEEKFIQTAPIREDMQLRYGDSQENIKHAVSQEHRYKNLVKEYGKNDRMKVISEYGAMDLKDIFIRQARRNIANLSDVPQSKVIEFIRAQESLQGERKVGNGAPVMIDRQRMIKNNENK